MINPKTETFTRSFYEYRLEDILVETIGDETPILWDGLYLSFPVQQNWLAEITTSAQQTLLIATDQLTNKKLIGYCQACFQRKVRVYLLLGKPEDSKEAIRLLSGHCLIRTGVKQAGSLLMADNSQGLILSSALVDRLQTTAVLRLVDEQLNAFYRYFCRLFWNQAKQEYLLPNQSRQVESSPFGEVAIENELHDSVVLRETLRKNWPNIKQATFSELRQQQWLVYPLRQLSTTDGQLVITLNQADAASLQTLVKHCTQQLAAFEEQPLTNLVLLASGEIIFLPPPTLQPNTAAWVVQLAEEQTSEVQAFLDYVLEQAPLQYQENCLLQAMANPFRFIDEPKRVYQRQQWLDHRIADIYLDSIATFRDPDIDSLTRRETQFNRERIAVEIEYTVTLHPPYLPTEAQPDKLHEQWKKTQEKWNRQIETLRGLLKKVEEQEQTFQGKVKSLLRTMLTGNLQWKSTKTKRLDELAQWSPLYADAVERQEQLAAINQVHEELHRKLGNMQDEVDKAQQQIVWEERRETLKKQLSETQNHQVQCTQQLEQWNADYQTQLQTKSTELKEQWLDFVRQQITQATWTKLIKSWSEKSQNWQDKFNEVPNLKNELTEWAVTWMVNLQTEEIIRMLEFKPFFKSLNKDEQQEVKRIAEIHSHFKNSSLTEKNKLEKELKRAEQQANLQQPVDKQEDKTRYHKAKNHRDHCAKELETWPENNRKLEQKMAQDLAAQWHKFVTEMMTAKTQTKHVQSLCANPQHWQENFEEVRIFLEGYLERLKEYLVALPAREIIRMIDLKPFFNSLNQNKKKDEKKEAKRIKDILSIFSKSSQTEKDKLEQKLKQAERQATDSQQAFDKHGDRFIYVASTQHDKSSLTGILGGAKKKTPKSTTFTIEWPKEELPASGTELYRDKKQRYLCITEETQFDQGQQDAQRLKAKLCTKY